MITNRLNNKSGRGLAFLIPAALCAMLVMSSCAGDEVDQDYFHRGEKSFASGKLKEAAKFYELFLEGQHNSPKRIIAWERLLLIYLDIGRNVDQGMNILRSMSVEYEMEQDKLWSIYMRIGRLHAQQNNFAGSIETLERAVMMAKDGEQLIRSYQEMAEVYYKKSEYQSALEVLNHFLGSIPDPCPDRKGRMTYLLGKIHYQLKDKQSAISYLRMTLYSDAGENQRSKAGMLLYEVYLEENDQAGAEEVLRELKKFYPNPMVIRVRLDDLQ